MASLQTFWPLLALAPVVLGLVFVAIRQKRLAAKLEQLDSLQQQLNSLQQALSQSQSHHGTFALEANELRSGAVAMGRRIAALEQNLEALAESQPAPEALEPERRIYSRAVRMVELGADVEEIMQECELPRAEAELVMSLHKQKQT